MLIKLNFFETNLKKIFGFRLSSFFIFLMFGLICFSMLNCQDLNLKELDDNKVEDLNLRISALADRLEIVDSVMLIVDRCYMIEIRAIKNNQLYVDRHVVPIWQEEGLTCHHLTNRLTVNRLSLFINNITVSGDKSVVQFLHDGQLYESVSDIICPHQNIECGGEFFVQDFETVDGQNCLRRGGVPCQD